MSLLLEQVRQAYAGQASEDEAPGEFAQYLEWRSEVVLDEDAATARTYWQQHLQGLQADIATPWLAARSTVSGTANAQVSLSLEPARRDALQRLADQLGQPLATLLQGAWWVLLGRLSGLEQALVGVRHDSRGDYEYFANAIGVFEKPAALRSAAGHRAVQRVAGGAGGTPRSTSHLAGILGAGAGARRGVSGLWLYGRPGADYQQQRRFGLGG